jgi:hypothetical protein
MEVLGGMLWLSEIQGGDREDRFKNQGVGEGFDRKGNCPSGSFTAIIHTREVTSTAIQVITFSEITAHSLRDGALTTRDIVTTK